MSLFVFLSGFAVLQTSSDRILEESKVALKALKDFSADFTYEISNPGMKNPVAKKGTLKYKKGKYVVKLDDQEIFCDLETMWIYLKDDNEVNIMEYDPQEGMDIEAVFNLYESNATSRYDGEQKVHGIDCHRIYLAMKDPKLEYNQAYLWINKSNKFLEKISLINRNQTTATYEFVNVRTNVGFEDKVFQFQPSEHAGVQVYDER
ncbi:MAG: hypothetical protein OHK0039_22690 [Bacteroidia bacterium]